MTAPKEKPQLESNDAFPELSKLRLSQEFLETGGANKILTTVPRGSAPVHHGTVAWRIPVVSFGQRRADRILATG